MSEKLITKEPTPQQYHFPSSGDTIVGDDVVVHDDFSNTVRTDLEVDESSQEGHVGNGTNGNTTTGRPSSADTVGPDPSGGLEVLGRGVKELVQAVSNLRHIGIEDLVLPLPKIVVVGDQSTGKSSLIEGISEIKVPRKLGVCTRCPLDINLSESANPTGPWICHISLYKKYVYEGTYGNSVGATRARPLGPWTLQDPEDIQFASTSDRDRVADLLEWAQIATLNPRSPHDAYMPESSNFTGQRTHQVKFSPNVVRVDIRGPNLPNLSFYDLPGVINVSDVADEEYLVNLVKNLVKEYIRDDKCINLLTLPMTDDPANSSASRLIRDVKAEARTVGVLTKPDRVQKAESIEQWMQILNGDKFKLGHGYHIVMNNPDVRVDHATARAQERDFFQQNEPWATELKNYDQRFGTLQLQAALSTKLTAQIRLSLPRITQQVLKKARQVSDRLQKLPAPPAGNLPRQIHEQIFVFAAETQKQFDGGDPAFPFRKDWNELILEFRKRMADSRPLLTQPPLPRIAQSTIEPSTPTPLQNDNGAAITIDSNDEEDVRITTPLSDRTLQSSNKRLFKVASPHRSSKRPRLNDIPLFTPKKVPPKSSYSKNFSLSEIRRILQEAHVGLPGQTDPRAIDRMICSSVEVWKEPLEHFLDSTVQMCQSMIADQIARAFGRWQETEFYSQTSEICTSLLERERASLRIIVDTIYKWETHKPMTYNEDAIRVASDMALASLRDGRRDHRARKLLIDQDARKDKTPSRMTFTERLAKVNDAHLGPDPFAQEVEAMSKVRGYYDCAFSRFVDNVCQAISCELFGTCRADIAVNLTEKLGLMSGDDHQRCAILLAADPENERERVQLNKEKETLRKAQIWLEGLVENEAEQE